VLDLLVNGENQRPWSEHEVALQIGDAIDAADAIAALRAAGLIHKTSDGFIFATRASSILTKVEPSQSPRGLGRRWSATREGASGGSWRR
jgi:hypothetical protein